MIRRDFFRHILGAAAMAWGGPLVAKAIEEDTREPISRCTIDGVVLHCHPDHYGKIVRAFGIDHEGRMSVLGPERHTAEVMGDEIFRAFQDVKRRFADMLDA